MTTYEKALRNGIIKTYERDGLTIDEAYKLLGKEYKMLFNCYESMTRKEALEIIFDNNFCTF